ncbi:alpha/beta fold hydrolase [Bacillus sp. Marseille-Q3570]|uniref:alpha/beta fold hydrolase n=1 Tax=Bacillus sp. Marseille-Q3570 TaxID=2963522 RepID=UPI0021B73129|nr:prolyl oligopeptidase family serine peptidase [Bacillus sp. Marseille-Q3570]
MIKISTEYIQNIPILNVAKEDVFTNTLPTLVFLHGFTSSKEQNLSYAYLLAKNGIRVLLPDFPLHGERCDPISVEERQWKFWDIVVQGITELKEVADHYVTNGQTDSGRIGVAGTSMGSITMFGALTQYGWIRTAVSLMGTPGYEQFANLMIQSIQKEGRQLPLSTSELESKVQSLKPYDLSLNPRLLGDRSLWIWHGKVDNIVPYQLTKQFYESIVEAGLFRENQVEMVTDPIAGHKVTRDACHRAVEWVIKTL